VFVSNHRRAVFTDPMLTFCEHLRREVRAGSGAELRQFNGKTDHVHLLMRDPTKAARYASRRTGSACSRP
jgi:putative transposase